MVKFVRRGPIVSHLSTCRRPQEHRFCPVAGRNLRFLTASARYSTDRGSVGPQSPLSYVGRAPVARPRRAGHPPSPRLRGTNRSPPYRAIRFLTGLPRVCYNSTVKRWASSAGGARLLGMEEVAGSNPAWSTTLRMGNSVEFPVLRVASHLDLFAGQRHGSFRCEGWPA